MFEYCSDPSILGTFDWFSCYLTNGKHLLFYKSFALIILLLLITAPLSILLGLLAAVGIKSTSFLLRVISKTYANIVRGIPDIIFFLFIPITIDQVIEFSRHKIKCPNVIESVWQGNDFIVCSAAKLPLNSDPQWIHDIYGFSLAILSFTIVYGAFAANTFYGAMNSVVQSQIDTGKSFGMNRRQIYLRIIFPQMWRYALPGLSNLWMLLIKSTPLLFLLGIQDIVYWARELGGSKTSIFQYPHPDWRIWYFIALLIFYLLLTKVSENIIKKISKKLYIPI
jgi:polar amino acid transport system permease protein